MVPTPELIKQLRLLIDEKDETKFTDDELEIILQSSDNIYAAASFAWTLKAAKVQEELGNIESYSIGAESYTYRSLTDMVDYCLRMAEVYGRMSNAGARILQVKPPDVL